MFETHLEIHVPRVLAQREASRARALLAVVVAVAMGVVGRTAEAHALLPIPVRAPATKDPAITRALDDQRAMNEKAYQSSREYLLEVHKGRWVVIVDGLVIASFARLDDALVAADERDSQADHRFIFRPGVDDGDEDFVQSPWMNENPSWFQLGGRFQRAFPMTRSWDTWSRNGKSVAAPGGRTRVLLSIPGNSVDPVTSSAFPVSSGLFEQDLTVTGQVAERLQLARYSVPGSAWIDWTGRLECRKVLCRLQLPELEIDTTLVAFVFPEETVASLEVVPEPDELFEILSGMGGDESQPPADPRASVVGHPAFIRGEIHATEDKSVAWGPTRDGLQAGLRLPGGDAVRVGDQLELEFLVRNVGDDVIRLESSDWREEDEITLLAIGGEKAGVDRIWYSGIARMVRYELAPGAQITLRSGAFGIRMPGKEHSEHPVVYDAKVGPGRYAMSFQLRFPDIDHTDDHQEAPKNNDFEGTLTTGAVQVSVLPTDDS